MFTFGKKNQNVVEKCEKKESIEKTSPTISRPSLRNLLYNINEIDSVQLYLIYEYIISSILRLNISQIEVIDLTDTCKFSSYPYCRLHPTFSEKSRRLEKWIFNRLIVKLDHIDECDWVINCNSRDEVLELTIMIYTDVDHHEFSFFHDFEKSECNINIELADNLLSMTLPPLSQKNKFNTNEKLKQLNHVEKSKITDVLIIALEAFYQ